ncbi:MAG: nuclear transport factor 2 family protein [Woeseiaceae bacterium]|nr:nuclear transport factor 2 family protein [Woeseiaceae bacterium]
MIRTILGATLLVLGTGLMVFTAAAGDRDDDVAMLMEKKVVEWPKLYAERDADGLDRFLSDGFSVLEPDGTVRTKDEEVAWLRETPPDEAQSDFIFTITEIKFAADNIAIVYGHGDSTRETDDGRPCHHNYWSSNTFILEDEVWKPVFSHISGISCTPKE